jgi:trimeric autotransporter adhesin
MRSSVVVLGFLSVLLAVHTAAAQCDPVVQPGAAVAGVFGSVDATVAWDPDGTGPLGEHLVVGGNFTIAGAVRASGIALFDPVTSQWSQLGNLTGRVMALAVLPNGDLVAGGRSLRIGTVDAHCVARWDGSAWNPLGAGISIPGPMTNRDVRAFAVHPNGDLIVGGQFGLAGGVPAGCIARWDGSTWHAMGDLFIAFFLPSCDAVVALPNGDVIAGGIFVSAGGVACNHVARWNGATWDAMSGGVTSPGLGYVRTLSQRANGDVIAGGFFSAVGGVPAQNIARWNGSSWSSLGAGLGNPAYASRELPNGDLLAGGNSLVGTESVARWDGVAWSAFGNLPASVSAFAALANGELFAGGDFRPSGSFGGRGVARWTGSNWAALTAGSDGVVDEVLALDDGSFLVLGDIRAVAGVSVTRAAIFDGQNWRAAGEPIAALPSGGLITAAVAMPGGAAVLAVPTYQHQTNPYHTLQRWDGTAWQTIGVASHAVRTMAVAPNGDLYVGGDFSAIGSTLASDIAVWNGSTWSDGPATTSSIYALFFTRDGVLVAGGSSFPGFVATWNGSQWVPMGGGLQQPPSAFAELPNGDLVAIGNWAVVNGSPCQDIARWDGAAWHPLGTGIGLPFDPTGGDFVTTVVGLPNGDVLAGGDFESAGGVPVHEIARWDGTAWHDVGSGADGAVTSLATNARGAIAIGGKLLTFDGQLSAFVARLEPTCPALAVSYGTSCFGAPTSLQVEQLAFTGGVLRTRVDGVASSVLVLAVLGFAPAQVPLPAILPQGGAGCALLATADFVQVALPNGDVAHADVAIPRAPALVGAVLYNQALPIGAASPGGFVLTASNGQAAIIGGMW